MQELVLYFRPTCPFCQKVLAFVHSKQMDIPTKDISQNPDLKDELVTIGGKSQVPCLVINGEALYESDDIIAWLEQNYGKN